LVEFESGCYQQQRLYDDHYHTKQTESPHRIIATGGLVQFRQDPKINICFHAKIILNLYAQMANKL